MDLYYFASFSSDSSLESEENNGRELNVYGGKILKVKLWLEKSLIPYFHEFYKDMEVLIERKKPLCESLWICLSL